MKNENITVTVILALFTVSTNIYATTLPAYTLEIEDLLHVKTNKPSYRVRDTIGEDHFLFLRTLSSQVVTERSVTIT